MHRAAYHEWAKRSLSQAQGCEVAGVSRLWPECDTWGLFVSFYAEQLRHWLRFFRPEQFIVIPMTRYLSDNRRVMADLARQLGLVLTGGPTAPVSANKRTAEKHKLDGVTTEGLRAFFQSHNKDLTDLLRRERVHVSPDGRVPEGDRFFARPPR